MAKKDVRVMITLECTTEDCKSRNYTMTKNKREHAGRVEYKKYCSPCNKRTVHKETR